jgi:hypothetical protein
LLSFWIAKLTPPFLAAMSGLTDADKAKQAAVRIFDLIDRESEIDPLSEEGKKQNYLF